jgi:uncharacterized membrane protein
MDSWIYLAILKVFVTVFAVMIQKYIKFTGNLYPIITSIIATLFFIIYLVAFNNLKDLKEIKKNNIPLLILAGFLLFVFLLINYNLISKSSHPGYFKVLSVYELILILFLTYYFYNAEITIRNWTGFIFIIIGSVLLIKPN